LTSFFKKEKEKMMSTYSASGLLSLLDEDDFALKQLALKRMNSLQMINEFWAEISSHIRKIESLYENESFSDKELAALICSKIYYYLGSMDDSLQFALHAGPLFDINDSSEFSRTIIGIAIHKYIQLRQKDKKGEKSLEKIVDKMFERCFADGELFQALGLSIETKRLDKLEETIMKSSNVTEMCNYCFQLAQNVVSIREFRHEIFKSLLNVYRKTQSKDYVAIAQCLLLTADPVSLSQMLIELLSTNPTDRQNYQESLLSAYQIGFDMCDRAPQYFITTIINAINSKASLTETKGTGTSASTVTNKEATATSTSTSSDNDVGQVSAETSLDETFRSNCKKLISVLTGEVTIQLHVDFLLRRNKTDLSLLKNIKDSFDKNSIYHSATITANAFMHAGTTDDGFLRKNLDWLGQASNWAKFSATASLGVIHKGKIKDSMEILKAYLPESPLTSSTGATTTSSSGTSSRNRSAGGGGGVYSEGGSLYALGLIHSSQAGEAKEFLHRIVKNPSQDEVVQHGACLGLGLASLASGDEEIYESLKAILYLDNAVSGEAAAMAIGMCMLASKDSTPTDEMFSYAHETSHEKIIRGLAFGMALTKYGCEESADVLIDTLLGDKDPILRYGGAYTIGLAYCGTANSGAIRKLLHLAVSDVSDDVRRAAVINLGFLLFLVPSQCPRLVSLLAESYNPHVRYGAAMAIGISCAGTDLKEALDLLEPLAKDKVDFVRQGAFMALAMVVVQYSEAYDSRVGELRKLLETSWTPQRQEVMSKTGAILAAGIIDAGGRNVTISLQKNQHNKMRGIVGMAVFTQYWFWYPYLHFLSLAMEPTCLIGLNCDLKMPEFTFKSNAKPSLFGYPPPLKAPEKKAVTLAPTAQLSTTHKERSKEKKRKKRDGMEVDTDLETPGGETPMTATSTTKEQLENPFKDEIIKKEPDFEILHNPARVTMPQWKHISFNVDMKYLPLKKEMGIIMLKNLKPEENEVLVELRQSMAEEKEPEPPKSFKLSQLKN